jgi:hypothetical protein
MGVLNHYTLEAITYEEAAGMILHAIKEWRRLIIVYSGLERHVDPYVFGYSSAGNPLFKALQVSGASVGGAPAGWRVFQVMKLTEITEEVDEKMRPIYFEPLFTDPALLYPWIFNVIASVSK